MKSLPVPEQLQLQLDAIEVTVFSSNEAPLAGDDINTASANRVADRLGDALTDLPWSPKRCVQVPLMCEQAGADLEPDGLKPHVRHDREQFGELRAHRFVRRELLIWMHMQMEGGLRCVHPEEHVGVVRAPRMAVSRSEDPGRLGVDRRRTDDVHRLIVRVVSRIGAGERPRSFKIESLIP